MKLFGALLAVTVIMFGVQASVNAETKTDEILKSNYSYIKDAPIVDQGAVTMLMMEQPTQTADKEEQDSKLTLPKQCFAVNRGGVSCLH